MDLLTILAVAEKAKPDKAPFYVAGGVLAAWAVVLTALGMARPGFPGSQLSKRAVMAISALLVLGATSAAVLTS